MSNLKYDVFLSFRGEDTRENFTSHLYAELCRKTIETFIDNRLDRGEEISPALYRAIEESKIYVIILSEHYASSSWCLDELTEILKCKERYGREVIPVFYKVDPSNVRHQRHSYADDFVKHHQRFGGKVDAWKASLTQVAGLSGWDSQVTRPESTLVSEIVKDILKKLNSCFLSNYEGMTGIDMHIEQIQSLLLLELPTVRMIGIWGMGGIGKTTIASAVFEKLATQFCSKSIILNVQQEIERVGLDHVKRKYLSKLLGEDIPSSEHNFSFDPRLKRTKVLLVFDDVKDSDQLKDLIGTHSNFGQGSRIIVTSRDRQVLENANADEIYQVGEMDYQDSLQLFCLFAFKQNNPKESFLRLTEKVLNYAQGLPLALKVLGSLLYGKTKEVWESQLQKIKKLPDIKIFRLLKLSYDGLDDDQKDIFLDIACFHRGQFEKDVALTLDSCGFSAYIGMDVLKDRLQCVDDPGKRSRLWKPSDIYDVLSKKMALPNLKRLNLHNSMKLRRLPDLSLCPNIEEVCLSGCISLTQVYSSSFLNNLNILDLYGCTEVKSLNIPSNILTRSSASVTLRDCHNLETLLISGDYDVWESFSDTVPNTVPSINDFYRLDISNCKSLTCLPTEILNSKILRKLSLGGCLKLEELPEIKETMENLKVLILDKTTIKELPSSLHHLVGLEKLSLKSCTKLKTIPSFIGNLSNLFMLDLTYCESLETFPSNIFKLKLTELDFEGCSMLQTFPEILEPAESFTYINLTKTAIKELPSSLQLLVGLEELNLHSCTKLKTIPSSIGNLSKLLELDLTYCESLETFPCNIFKLKLTKLDFHGCSMLRIFPEIPNDIGRLSSLIELSLKGSSIVNLPESMAHLSSLKSLNLSDCKLLECVPKLPPNINQVLAFDCPSIKRITIN
ncbi:hypothetical protein TSUD_79120 [Trifolium subterraneum]|uniref:TIR domain-containing protein n=1 Tax=Trifolium subterraneum TaxID=3900 RepID=A0A2Z6M2G4_TRISU|nr:hypothetical protein TSUD_79120 [Trifolium subterraneum]